MSRARLLVLALVIALLSGCATIPTSGPVQTEPQRTHAAGVPIDVIPHAPGRDDSPSEIVQGFLHAMAEGRGDYSIARLYLAPDAATRWQPQDQAMIYAAASERWTVTDTSAILEAELMGRLDKRGSFTRVQDPYRIDFGLKPVDGQWRITNPPAGLLLVQELFDQAFVASTLYAFDPEYRALVPDVVYVPKLKRTPTWLVTELMMGPTDWLRPAVRSALPTRLALAGEVQVSTDGVATIPLAGEGAGLDDTARTLLAAQLAATLGGKGGEPIIGRIRVILNGGPFPIPAADSTGAVAVSQFDRYLPSNVQASAQAFGIHRDRVVRVNASQSSALVEPLEGFLGEPGMGAEKLAVAMDSTQLALVTNGSSKLWTAPLNGSNPSRLVLERPGLLTPQFTRFDELWTLASGPQGTQVYRVVKGQAEQVPAPELAGLEVTAFRLSPDGVRMAVVTRRAGESTLQLLQVRRGDEPTVAGLRPLRLTSSANSPATIDAVGWRSDRSVMLLGAERDKAEVNPYVVDQDAATVRRTSTQGWDVRRLQTSPYSGKFVALAIGPSGEVWRAGEDQVWRKLVGDMTAIALPG